MCVASTWPLAYCNVALEDHLLNVARLAECLFRDDVAVLERRLGFQQGVLWEVLLASALLHDVGKASYYYRKGFRNTCRLSFPMHEHVWSLVLYSIANVVLHRNGNTGLSDKLVMTARVISRHHAAMIGRHPVDISIRMRGHSGFGAARVESVRRPLKDLDPSLVANLLSSLMQKFPALANSNIWNALVNQALVSSGKKGAINNICGDMKRLANLENLPLKKSVAIKSLSGMLIVSDILAASLVEKRVSDDGIAPAYVIHWVNELRSKLRKCLPCVNLEGFQVGLEVFL
ncbi:MAG: CRISPR-associated endonuclease Cas3'' [Sulfolobales archaeon]|nr:CRISPR-associated endonuclease Cas3'' [Sulfolobales archaeon]